jgi:hypothetical protein
MSYDALRRGRYSLSQQVYCITTVTRDRCPLFTDMTTARVLVRDIGNYPHWDCIWMMDGDGTTMAE